MSSVLVKGMEMPKDCRECPFENYHSDIGQTVCMASLRVLAMHFDTISFDGRHPACPLAALPNKHGRLVDADEIKNKNPLHMELDVPYVTEVTVGEIIDNAPTIVEAEDSE